MGTPRTVNPSHRRKPGNNLTSDADHSRRQPDRSRGIPTRQENVTTHPDNLTTRQENVTARPEYMTARAEKLTAQWRVVGCSGTLTSYTEAFT
jgi:hypothetical protein